MIHLRNASLLLITSLALSGCISAYLPPPDSPTAKVRFKTVTPSTPLIFVRTQRSGEMRCQQLGSFGAPEVSKVQMLGSDREPHTDRLERMIQADKPFTIFFQEIGAPIATAGGLTGVNCKVPVSFTPIAGAEYEVVHQSDTVRGLCFISVQQLIATPDKIKRIPVEIQSLGKLTCL